MNVNWWQQILGGIVQWFAIVLPSAIAVIVLTFLVGIVRFRNPIRALNWTADLVVGFVADIARLSWTRIWAIAVHSLKEAVRRRVLLVLIIFGLVFLFAGWYFRVPPADQVKTYVSFIFRTIGILLFLVALLLACTSLPADIQRKTIHTVVTKPVLRLEIVLGRFLGVAVLCTVILGLMATVSYVYLLRITGLIGSAGTLDVMQRQIERYEQEGDTRKAEQLRQALEQIKAGLRARVPLYGELTFVDERGQENKEGVDVGFEVTRRGFIPGATAAHARWRFHNVPVELFLQKGSIPVELTFEVFRTIKEDVERGVKAELTYRNPYTGVYVRDYPFYVRENYVQRQELRDLPHTPENDVEAVLKGCRGELIVEARCLSPAQYIGMAQDDLYLLVQEDAGLGMNFFKGVLGVWFQVLLIAAIAIAFSTFLSTPVAILATITCLVCGQFMDFVAGIATESLPGGGFLESFIRLVTHENLLRPLPDTPWVRAALLLDKYFFNQILRGVTLILPDLSDYSIWVSVARGFYIDPGLVLLRGLVTVGYLVPFLIIGYLMLRSREIAR